MISESDDGTPPTPRVVPGSQIDPSDLIVARPELPVKSEDELAHPSKTEEVRRQRRRWREEGGLRPTTRRLLFLVLAGLAGAAGVRYYNAEYSDGVAAYVHRQRAAIGAWWAGER